MDFAKLRRHVRQYFHARVGHEHIVFNPDAAPIWKIRARLNREDHAGSHELVSNINVGPPADDPGIFVDVDAQTVTGAVTEGVAHPGLREAIARSAINGEP
jgi:hypothetical protein